MTILQIVHSCPTCWDINELACHGITLVLKKKGQSAFLVERANLIYEKTPKYKMAFTVALRACASVVRLAIFTVLPETVEYYYIIVSARFVHCAPF